MSMRMVIVCDDCRDTTIHTGPYADVAAQVAREAGWDVDDGTHLCPACRPRCPGCGTAIWVTTDCCADCDETLEPALEAIA